MRGLVIASLLAACSGGGAPPGIDAHPGGPLCSKQIYDLCVEEHDCDTLICQPFDMFSVCTTGCTSGTIDCPMDKSGAKGACDNGLCKPIAPNMCHLPGT